MFSNLYKATRKSYNQQSHKLILSAIFLHLQISSMNKNREKESPTILSAVFNIQPSVSIVFFFFFLCGMHH